MKVLHINCNYMGSLLHQNMMETLIEKGVNNRVFVPLKTLNNHPVKPKEYVTPVVCFKTINRFFYPIKQKKIIRALYENIDDISQYSCIHAYTVFTDGNVARTLSKKYNIPYVVAVRSTDLNMFFKNLFFLRNIGINVLRDAKAIFFLSETYRETLLNRYIPMQYREEIMRKSYIVPNGIDDFWHENLFLNKDIDEVVNRIEKKEIKIVYAGGIDRNKNVVLTCKAKKILEKKGWKVDFYVVGKIRERLTYNRIKKEIIYFDARPKEKLIDIYRKADIFVLPSHHETFGLVYAEAMSQGLPVLYTRKQGFDGQFEDGKVGYAISDWNADSLADSIIKVTENYVSLAQNSMKCVNKFKWSEICDIYYNIYKENEGVNNARNS